MIEGIALGDPSVKNKRILKVNCVRKVNILSAPVADEDSLLNILSPAIADDDRLVNTQSPPVDYWNISNAMAYLNENGAFGKKNVVLGISRTGSTALINSHIYL